jgi:Mg2+ and Co2+ transporter CorA
MEKPEFMEKIEEDVKKAEEELVKLQQSQQGQEKPTVETPVENNPPTTEEPAKVEISEEPVAGPEPKPQEEGDDWEHKYRVLQGKYNAEVPRLHEENRRLREDIEFLKGKMELLQQMVVEKPEEPPAQPQKTEVEDEDIKMLEAEFPEIYRAVRKLLDRYAPKEEIESKLRDTEEQLKKTRYESFIKRLTELVPDWERLNSDPIFLSWLQERAPYSVRTKHELMLEAYEIGDADTVSRFFIDFKNTNQPSTISQSNTEQLESMVAPPRSKSTAAVGTQSKTVLSLRNLEQAYKDVVKGKISKEELGRLEKEYVRAMSEGRVIN